MQIHSDGSGSNTQRGQLLSTASQDLTSCLLNRLGRPAETVCLQIKDALGGGQNSLERRKEPQDQS